mgnify:CR=1 FL=1
MLRERLLVRVDSTWKYNLLLFMEQKWSQYNVTYAVSNKTSWSDNLDVSGNWFTVQFAAFSLELDKCNEDVSLMNNTLIEMQAGIGELESEYSELLDVKAKLESLVTSLNTAISDSRDLAWTRFTSDCSVRSGTLWVPLEQFISYFVLLLFLLWFTYSTYLSWSIWLYLDVLLLFTL